MPARTSDHEPRSVFGVLTLVVGPETLLADRAVAEVLSRARAESPEAEVTELPAERMDGTALIEASGGSLFASRRIVVVTDLGAIDPALHSLVLELASVPPEDLAVVLVHGGGQRGKGLLDKLRATKPQLVECPALRPWELPQFVAAEARRGGGRIDQGAATALVDAVGHDLRSLAAGVAQLHADGEDDLITVEQVRRYFGGRSEVTSFAVADAVLAGQTGVALEQLRWALSTGVVSVLVTSALASGVRGLGRLISAGSGVREVDLAREVGVPPWKIKSMRVQARGWDAAGLAAALRAVAEADAAVKGAVDDADYALERMVLTVAAARRG